MASFALVAEGITDQIVLETILSGYYDEDDLEINPLQPLRDATDRFRQGNFAGWELVFEFCSDQDRLAEALAFNDFFLLAPTLLRGSKCGRSASSAKTGRGASVRRSHAGAWEREDWPSALDLMAVRPERGSESGLTERQRGVRERSDQRRSIGIHLVFSGPM